jgi:hypothetical protein
MRLSAFERNKHLERKKSSRPLGNPGGSRAPHQSKLAQAVWM